MSRRRRTSLAYRRPSEPRRTPIVIYIFLIALCIGGFYMSKQNLLKSVSGRVIDAYSGQPVAGATVTITNERKLARTAGISETLQISTDNDGVFSFPQTAEKFKVAAQYNNYRTTTVDSSGSYTVELKLTPTFLKGMVRDDTGLAIPRALVTLGDKTLETAVDGSFNFQDVPETGSVSVRAPGFRRESQNYNRQVSLEFKLSQLKTKGVYIAPADLASPSSFKRVLDNLHPSVTAVVVDLKDERGQVLFNTKVPVAKDAMAGADRKIPDMAEMLKAFQGKKLYTIGRIVCFQDPVLTDLKPEWTLKSRSTGKLWADRIGFNWVNPYNREAWEYYLGLAEEAAKAGFDEIQFVGLHFPVMGTLADIDYNLPDNRVSNAQTRMEAVTGFLKIARDRLSPLGVYTSLSVFGSALIESNDLGIGMDLRQVAPFVDYISPIIYPAEWGDGAFGIDKPLAKPGELVKQAMLSAQEVFKERLAMVRPWLQDFPASGTTFTGEQVLDEIRAVEEFQKVRGAGWLLYNPSSRYSLPAS